MTDAASLLALLPPGTLDLAVGLRRAGHHRLHQLTGEVVDTDADEVATLLALPRLLDDGWPAPATPIVVGDGAVHADLIDDDLDLFDHLLHSMPGAGPEAVAAAAQQCRLPVTPYRRPPRDTPPTSTRPTSTQPAERADQLVPRPDGLAGARVVDLTTLWAGPLCTALLAHHGAAVIKVEPSCRPDGMRTSSALYRWLNASKTLLDLDLRRAADRCEFEHLVRSADVLVHSFSRRVMPNLGYGRDRLRCLNPRLATVAISAFGSHQPEHDWVAYGGGVHAASGLGLLGGVPTPAPIAYPDPLAGLAAFTSAVELLGRPTPGGHAEVSLAGVIAPLLPTPTRTAAPATAGSRA